MIVFPKYEGKSAKEWFYLYEKATLERDALLGALREISKGEGRYSRDQQTFANNCIEDMKQLAVNAIALCESPQHDPSGE